MTNLRVTLGSLAIIATLFTSCGDNNDAIGEDEAIVPPPPTRAIPTSQEFTAIKTLALENQTQDFEIELESPTFTTAKGVEITLPTGPCLTKNGDAVTGTVLVEVIELFEKGQMLTTNKTTMGRMENGDKGLLISGGEFYINATQDGVTLETPCGFQVEIPADLTGGVDMDMTLWKGVADCDGLDDDCDGITWEQDFPGEETPNGMEIGDNAYYPFFNGFGWTNVDRFYSDPRDKTTILVDVPEGYDNTNSSVYLSYDGEANALANLDTYDATTQLFSEHYGLIPIGLECHVIFVSEADGAWLYAIKAATIVANGTIVIAEADLGTATEAELITLMNALP